jgi:phosphoglycolate phosphatase
MLNYIFDLDGTIINSSKEVILCFEKAFKKANYTIDKSKLTSNLIGPPLKQILQNIAPDLKDENKLQEILENFNQFYDYDENDISELYFGIYEILQKLKQQGNHIFLATFKPTKPTLRIVNQFKLNMFDDIYTIDKFGEHITKTDMINDIVNKYKIKKSETVMIGDAASDVIAAKQAKVKAVGVLWGYGDDKTELIKNSDILLHEVKEILTL